MKDETREKIRQYRIGKWSMEKNPSWKGGIKYGNGYRFLKRPDHPFKSYDGYVMEHRLVMEAHLGRILERSEIVHHLSGDKLDNRLCNLQLMTLSDHSKLHNPVGRRILQGWAREFDKCVDCGTVERPHYCNGCCERCYGKRKYWKNRDKERVYRRNKYQANREQYLKTNKDYYEANPDKKAKKLAYRREYGKANLMELRKQKAEYRAKNRERLRAYFRAYYKKTHDKATL